jgi:hypothetical protein
MFAQSAHESAQGKISAQRLTLKEVLRECRNEANPNSGETQDQADPSWISNGELQHT